MGMRLMVIATIKSGIGQIIVLILNVISMKLLAVLTGPSGVGLFSILRNAQQSLTSVAALGGSGNSIVQGLASWHVEQRDRFLVSAFWTFFTFNLLVCIVVLVIPNKLVKIIFPNNDVGLLSLLLIPVVLSSIMVFLRGVLNANIKIESVVWVNIMMALGALFFIYPACIAYNRGQPHGLILILLGTFLFGGLASLFLLKKQISIKISLIKVKSNFSKSAAMHLIYVSFPTIISAFVGMASVFFIRMTIAEKYSISAAGWFDVAWGIGALFLTMFLTSLQTYLLPVASSSTDDMNDHLAIALRFSSIVVVPGLLVLIVMKPYIVNILYSNSFSPALEIMRWTILGDLFRAYGSVFATILIARADMFAFLIRELIWSFVFVAVSFFFMSYGIWAVGIGYLSAYFVYFVMHVWRVFSCGSLSLRSLDLMQWLFGCLIVIAASVLAWDSLEFEWVGGFTILLGLGYAYAILRDNERAYIFSYVKKIINK